MQKVSPFLWYDDDAEEAVDFYVSVFPNAKKGKVSGPPGIGQGVSFEIEGQHLTAFNGGPQFKFNESISLYVDCQGQEEVDYYWSRLVEGGEESRCGWLKDRYGLSWQVVPRELPAMLADPDREKANRAIQAMLKMNKLDIATLKEAYEG